MLVESVGLNKILQITIMTLLEVFNEKPKFKTLQNTSPNDKYKISHVEICSCILSEHQSGAPQLTKPGWFTPSILTSLTLLKLHNTGFSLA